MKNLKLLVVALVAMFGFIACDKHECNDYDHSADLVGTWTCLQAGYAEALVIKADGSAVSTGFDGTEYWENVAGNIVVKNGTVTMTFKDNGNFKGHFDIVPDVAFSIFTEEGEHMTYYYCANDLADEIVGMWVSSDTPTGSDEKMTVQIYKENGKAVYTGFGSYVDEYVVNKEADYKVVGDLLFYALPKEALSGSMAPYITNRLTYSPNANAFGDIMSQKAEQMIDGKVVVATSTMLRMKQDLNFTGKTYDYISAYVSNVNGTNEDFTILGNTFNISNIKSENLDMLFRSVLSCIELDANTFTYKLNLNGKEIEMNDKITVEGNKVTVDMSTTNSACRKVDMYMFQDADDTQLHIYMPTKSFVNYFANLQIPTLVSEGKLDTTNATAVEKVFTDMGARIQSINVSLIYKARK